MKPSPKPCALPSLAAFLVLSLSTACTSVEADVVLPDGVKYLQTVSGADGQSRRVDLYQVGVFGWVFGAATVVGLVPCIAVNNTREAIDIEIDRKTLESNGVTTDRIVEIIDRGWNRLRGVVRVAEASYGPNPCRIEVPIRKFVDAAVSGMEQQYTPSKEPRASMTIQRVASR